MSSLGKRMYGGGAAGYTKRARTAPTAMAKSRTSSRYNARYSSRGSSSGYSMQRARGAIVDMGYIDTNGTYALDTTGDVVLLNQVTQGAGVTQRVGKKIILKSLQMRGAWDTNLDAIANDVAFVVVYDKRPTGVPPAITDIFDNVDPRSMNKDDNAGRFVMLKRENCVLIGNTNAIANCTDASYKGADYYLSLRNLPTVYKSAGTGGIGDIEQGALYLVTMGNRPPGTQAANLNVYVRTKFVDV